MCEFEVLPDFEDCDSSLTPGDCAEIEARQSLFEIRALRGLQTAITHLENFLVAPNRHIENLPYQLEDAIALAQDWIRHDPPSPSHFADLQTYLRSPEGGLPPYMDRTELLDGLRSIEHIRDTLTQGTDSALSALGVPLTEGNRHAALTCLLRAKLHAMTDFRNSLIDPEWPPRPLTFASDARLPDNCQPLDLPVLYPCEHLLSVDHTGWPADHRLTAASTHNSPPAARSSASVVEHPMARATIAEWAAEFLRLSPFTGRSEAGPDDKRVTWRPGTADQFLVAIRLANDVCPGPMTAVTHADLDRLNLTFGKLPRSWGKSPRHRRMTINDIVTETREREARGKLRSDRIGLGVSTINRHFHFLHQLFDWVGERVALHPISWKRLYTKDKRNPRLLRDAFTVDKARQTFALPPYTGCQSKGRRFLPGDELFHDAIFWVPILIANGGARLAEYTNRMVSDVEQRDGIWGIQILPNELGPLKNSFSERWIPFSDEVLRLGFLDYWRALAVLGHKRLFPELDAKEPGDQFDKKFLRQIRIYLPFLKEFMGPHAFRHFVETELKDKRVPEEVRNDLLGRKNASIGANTYAKQSRSARLQEVVNLIPVVTAHLQPRPIRLLPSIDRAIPTKPSPKRKSERARQRTSGTRNAPRKTSGNRRKGEWNGHLGAEWWVHS